jgi:hypothetical protein
LKLIRNFVVVFSYSWVNIYRNFKPFKLVNEQNKSKILSEISMNGYQLLCELTAIKKRKLSDEARKKLQDAGIIKPEAEYLKGWRRELKILLKDTK